MKIKNIMFSGVAAAIFAGVCGAADAATISLISKDYADTQLQAKLTAGDNIAIADDGKTISATGLIKTAELEAAVSALETQINAKASSADMTTAQQDIAAAEAAIELLKSGKADKTTVENLQTAINNLGDTYATDAEVEGLIDGVKALIPTKVSAFENDAGYLISTDLADYAKTADVNTELAKKADQSSLDSVSAVANAAAAKTYVDEELAKKADVGSSYTTTESDAKYLIMRDANVLGANLQWNEAGKLDTKGIATADGLKELEDQVKAAVTQTELEQKGYQTADDVATAIEGKADSTTVATDIADALAEAKQYADANDADTVYDDTQVRADIASNKAAIEGLQGAGYQTATDVEGKITTATSTLATKAEVNAVDAIAKAAAVKTDVDAAMALKADASAIADMATNASVEQAITDLDLANTYAAKSYEARVVANEAAIATNTSGVAANKAATETNAGAIEVLQKAGYVVGAKATGSYLVNFDANGVASYAAVQILDENGVPIDLTTGAVK